MPRLRLTPNLIRLERGGRELLLADSRRLYPIYIPRGFEYVDEVIGSAVAADDEGDLRRKFPDDGPLIDLLFQHRILVPSDTPEDRFRIDSAEAVRGKSVRRKITLYLILTQGCNLGCTYCLNGLQTYHKESPGRMSETEAMAAVRRSLEALEPGGELEVALFGGEPLLNWPLAKRTVERTVSEIQPEHPDKKIHFHFTSNLTVLPPDLIELARKHGITFLCDVDGPPKIHDRCRPYKGGRPSHADTARHIRRLTDAGLRVSLRATITALNQDYLPEIAEHHRELGGVSSAFVSVSPVDSDQRIFPSELLPDPDRVISGLLEAYGLGVFPSDKMFPFSTYGDKVRPGGASVLGCGAPYGNTPVVDAGGAVYPCLYLVGNPKYRLGDAIRGPLLDEPLLDGLIQRLHVDRNGECPDCAWRYLCGGGCPVWRLLVLENPKAGSAVKEYCRRINCDFTKAVLEVLLWELAGEAATAAEGIEPESTGAAREAMVYC